ARGPVHRVPAPPGGSSLSTSLPKAASSFVANAEATEPPTSSTRTPERIAPSSATPQPVEAAVLVVARTPGILLGDTEGPVGEELPFEEGVLVTVVDPALLELGHALDVGPHGGELLRAQVAAEVDARSFRHS